MASSSRLGRREDGAADSPSSPHFTSDSVPFDNSRGAPGVFLRKLVPGGASRSYGIEVARLAGLPAEVLARAREMLKNLESLEVDEGGHAALARGGGRRAAPAGQLGLFAGPAPRLEALPRDLRGLDLESLRPLDALNLLAEWKKRLG